MDITSFPVYIWYLMKNRNNGERYEFMLCCEHVEEKVSEVVKVLETLSQPSMAPN